MKGNIVFELTSADIPGALQAIAQAGIVLTDVVQTGDLDVRLCIQRQDQIKLEGIVERRGERLRRLARLGSYWKYLAIIHHPVLILGILFLLALTVFLPTRVLFIRVEGNVSIPTALILEKAEACGIVFGAERGEVRSERMKNALLDAIPELQWAGINTSGCVATISVRERKIQDESEEIIGIGSIVAARDGVITSCTVSWGTALCRPGQAVRAGETLVSGYTDCGGAILSGMAEGEVFAETNRQLLAVTPDIRTLRGDIQRHETRFSLLLGKNRINFYKDSGILDATCVKMYTEYYMTLPGGFRLPIALVREDLIYYDETTEPAMAEEAGTALSGYVREYLESQMAAGQILSQQETIDGCRLYGNYICLEMIGQVRYEEIIDKYGENYGENG